MRLVVLFLLVASAAPVSAPRAQPADTLAVPIAAPDSVEAGVSRDPVTGERETVAAPAYGSFDARAVRAVYRVRQPVFVAVMRGANEAAYPAFAAAAPATAAVALARGGSLRPAVRVAVAEAITAGTVLAFKRVLRRPRPYRALSEIAPRDRRFVAGDAPLDPYSFPSGHASLAFAVATSVALNDSRLAAPALLWATATSVSRVWHGVHYPSDVAVGAALGAGAAVVTRLLLPSPSGTDAAHVPFSVVVSF